MISLTANQLSLSLAKPMTLAHLLLERFLTDESAPLTSPRSCEPGPGTLTIGDTNNVIAISGGALHVNGSPDGADVVASQTQFARQAGRAFLMKTLDRTNIGNSVRLGFSNNNGNSAVDVGLDYSSATTIRIKDGISVVDGSVGVPAGDNEFACVLRSAGGFLLLKDGSGNWILHWIYTSPATDQYAKLRVGSGAKDYKSDDWRVADLGDPWATAYAVATERLSGSQSAGQTFSHEADCLLEFTVDTLPSSGQIELFFRIQDANNYWAVTINSSGDIDLGEVVSGSTTQRGTSAAAVAAGNRIVVMADDTEIRVYANDAKVITYASASNFKTETAGELDTLGTGGAVSDIVSWPRTISGNALQALKRV